MSRSCATRPTSSTCDTALFDRRSFIGFLAAAFTIVVWGVTFVNTKALLGSFSALEIQVLRFAVAYVALWPLYPRLRRVRWRDELMFVALGGSGVAVYQLLENCAISYTNASNVAILVSLCPLATALLVRFAGRGRRLTARFCAGCAIAMAGVTMVSANGVGELRFRPFGDLLALAAVASWAVYSLLVGKIADRGYSQLFVVRRMFFWALAMMVPLVVFGLTSAGRTVMSGSLAIETAADANAARFSDPLNFVNLGFLGLLASAMCFVLWNRACALLGVARCTVGIYLIPAVTVLFAAAFLGERMTFASAAGALLIVIGVVLSGKSG